MSEVIASTRLLLPKALSPRKGTFTSMANAVLRRTGCVWPEIVGSGGNKARAVVQAGPKAYYCDTT